MRGRSRGSDPGAIPAGWVIGALNPEIAKWVFDSGYPGSAQVVRAHRFGRSIATVNDDYGFCGLYGRPREMLRHWLDLGARPRDILGTAVSDRVLERLLADQRRED